MSEHTVTPWRVEYDNNTGPNDEGYWEFWRLCGPQGGSIGQIDSPKWAQKVVETLNAHDSLVAENERLRKALEDISQIHTVPMADWSEKDLIDALMLLLNDARDTARAALTGKEG